MRLLFEHGRKRFYEDTLAEPVILRLPFDGLPFVCLIWDHVGDWIAGAKEEIGRQLIRGGCRYVVCGGRDCEGWHDNVDYAFVTEHLDEPEEKLDALHVMTSWHADEWPEDVAFFFVLCTSFDYFEALNFLVLHIGGGPDKEPLEHWVRHFAEGNIELGT